MSSARGVLVSSFLLVLAGCQCGASEPPLSAAPPPSSVAPPPSSSVVDAGARVLDPAARAHLRELLHTGRVAARAGHYDEALAAFEEIVSLDPQDRRLRCEAGYVAYRGGQPERARVLVNAALAGMSDPTHVPEPLRIQTAQCLYNAGLVRESAGDLAGARAAWTSSLALRPNATVQAHLTALPVAPATPEVLSLGLPRGTSDVDVDAALVRRLGADAEAELWSDLDRTDYATTPVTRIEIVADPGVTLPPGVAVLEMEQLHHIGAVVVHDGDALTALVVIDLEVGGYAGVMNDARILSARATDLVSGGAPELVLEITEDDEDQDEGGCLVYTSYEARRVVCTLGPTPGCAVLHTSSGSSEVCDPACTTDPDAEEGDETPADDAPPPVVCGRDGYPPAGRTDADPRRATLVFHDATAVYAGTLAGDSAGTYQLGGLLASFGLPSITVHPFE